MGTPDMLGTYGTYQHFAENNPREPIDEAGGKRAPLRFQADTATRKSLDRKTPFAKTRETSCWTS